MYKIFMNYRSMAPLTLIAFFAMVTLFITGIAYTALAGATHNLIGFAWGGTTSVDGAYQGIGWLSFNNISDGSTVDYGVSIPPGDGVVTGNAWSEYYGWLSFDAANLAGCPSGTCTARKVGTTLEGWARFLSIKNEAANAGGWEGWVNLSGVSIAGSNLSGYAWADEMGWINFTGVTLAVQVNLTSTNLIVPAAASVGTALNFSATVTNTGTVSTGGTFSDNFSYRYGATGAWTDLPLIAKPALAPGATSPDAGTYTPTTAGTLYIQHCVDSSTQIAENDESNCTVSAAVTVVAAPSVSITVATPCSISAGTDQCTAATTWEFQNATAPYSIINTNTGTTIGTTVSDLVGAATVYRYGLNSVEGRASGVLLGALNMTTGCASGLAWSALTSHCEAAPTIALSATPALVRSGSTAEIRVTVTSANLTTCTILNATPASPYTLTHTGSLTATVHGPITSKPLTSAQVITLQCTDTVTGFNATAEARINVVPTIQEV